MTLMRRPPLFPELESLRDVTERLFDERFWRPLWGGDGERDVIPPLDLYSTPEAIVARLALPGVKPEDVDVTITDDFVTIRGSFKEEKEIAEAGYVHRELGHGAFSRRFFVAVPIKTDEVQATFKDGLLTITLPKVKEVEAKHVKIDVESVGQLADVGSPGGPVIPKP
jgi:HSP20 family protein